MNSGKSVLKLLADANEKEMSRFLKKMIDFNKSTELFSCLHTKVNENNLNGELIILGDCKTAMPAEIMMEIFKKLYSQDIAAFSQTSRASYLLTHNVNKTFWDKYAPGIIQLNFLHLDPSKPVLSCMINSAEKEMLHNLKKEISKVQPFQRYLFQCSFIFEKNEQATRELLKPAVEIEIGQREWQTLTTKKWIFRNEFTPSYYATDSMGFFPGAQTNHSSPSKINYFVIYNIPFFSTISQANTGEEFQPRVMAFVVKKLLGVDIRGPEEFETDDAYAKEIMKSVVKKFAPEVELLYPEDFATLDEYDVYGENVGKLLESTGLKEFFTSMENQEKMYPLHLEYAETLSEEKRKLYLQLVKEQKYNADIREKQIAMLDEMHLKGPSIQLGKLERSLKNRIKEITSSGYVYDGKPGTDKTPEEYRPLTFGAQVCKKITTLITYGTAIAVSAYAIEFFVSKS
ncbi:MAG: hypothetical protein H0U49_03470 [Parachlamydiaceae bacterium]|nr:hypothetical protein [Parachlamydiaceae bacterium]